MSPAAALQGDRAKAKREERIADGQDYLAQFLAERIEYPWPDGSINHYGNGIPSSYLYSHYVKTGPDPLLRQQEFGEAVRALGYRSSRDDENRVTWPSFYFGWAEIDSTRLSRAEGEVASQLTSAVWSEGYDRILRDHMERVHPGEDGGRLVGVGEDQRFEPTCKHVMPDAVLKTLRNERDALVAAAKADGTFSRLMADQFGPFLRWRPGDPDPCLLSAIEPARRALARAESELSDVEDRFLEVKAAYDATAKEEPAPKQEDDRPLTVLDQMTAGIMSRTARPRDRRAAAEKAALDAADEVRWAQAVVDRAADRLRRAAEAAAEPFWPMGWTNPDEEAVSAEHEAKLAVEEQRRAAAW